MNRVVNNAVWIIACKICQSVLALIINMLTARYLGPSNYGLITYASSLVAFVLPVMQLGFSNILVQEIINKTDQEGTILGTSMLLSLGSSICCIIGVTGFSIIANHNEPITIVVCLLYSLNLMFQALELMQYWFQAKLKSKYTSIICLIAYVIVSAYKAFLLISQKSVYWFAISNMLDSGLIAVGMIYIYKKLGGEKIKFSWEMGKRMFSRSKHYIISGMMVTVFAQTDKIMIKLMIDEEATGFYGAAVYCAGLTSFVFTAIIDSFRPSIFEGRKISEQIFEYRLTLLYSIIIYVSLAQSLMMTLLAGFIIKIIYGSAYAQSAVALQIVVWYTTFSYIGSVRNIWILANGKQHYLWSINMSGAIANIVINAALIPVIGINGAAVASLVTQFFTNVIIGYIIKDIRPNNAIMVKGLNPRYLLEAVNKILPIHHRI